MQSWKTPTTVLLTPDKEFDTFGFDAEDKYCELADIEEHRDWYFFKRFKMLLHGRMVGIKLSLYYFDFPMPGKVNQSHRLVFRLVLHVHV